MNMIITCSAKLLQPFLSPGYGNASTWGRLYGDLPSRTGSRHPGVCEPDIHGFEGLSTPEVQICYDSQQGLHRACMEVVFGPMKQDSRNHDIIWWL